MLKTNTTISNGVKKKKKLMRNSLKTIYLFLVRKKNAD